MEKRILIAGVGGQGVMLTGQVLCYSATEDGMEGVSFFPSYGAEQRGGTANCFVVITDGIVGSPIPQKVDDLLVFHDSALKKFEDRLFPGGLLFVNSDTVRKRPDREDVTIVEIPAAQIAAEIGNGRSQNLVMLGAYLGYTGVVRLDAAQAIVEKKLGKKRPQLIPSNRMAVERGYESGCRHRKAEKKQRSENIL